MKKIVDTFNGYEDDRRFPMKSDAEAALDIAIAEFHQANPGATCKLAIVDADDEWSFDPRRNAFRWW